MGVFPPWIESLHHRYGVTDRPAGYALIFRPPAPTHSITAGIRVDIARLLLQWAIICLGSGIVLIWQGSRSSSQRQSNGVGLDDGGVSSCMATSNEGDVYEAPPTTARLGLKWMYWWIYVTLPMGGLLGIMLSVNQPLSAAIMFPLSLFHIAVASGLHKKQYWAWRWNWLLVVVTWLEISLPYRASDFGAFLFNYPFLMTASSLLWLWPNYIYWNRRKHLFN